MSTTAFFPPFSVTEKKLCGCFSIDTGTPARDRRRYLPLLASEAHITILSRTCRTVLKQTFVKPLAAKKNTEFMYEFPLRDGVTVVGFNSRIGIKPALYCTVKEKRNAPATFDGTMVEGGNVGLLTQVPESVDMFCTMIGSVEVGEGIVIDITYIDELKHDDDIEGMRFMIPTMIARRNFHAFINPFWTGEIDAIIPPLDHSGIRINVDIILPGEHIKGVESPSHRIEVSKGTISVDAQAAHVMEKASATLSLETASLDKDFVLIIQLKPSKISKALLERHSTISNQAALMITLPTPLFCFSSFSPSEIILVVDRSASMRHVMPMLNSALKVLLKSLPTSVKFNICSFGTENTFLWTQSKSYTNSTVQEAIQHISTFEADYGETEIFKAIQATIDRRLTDLPLDVILFTDGNITDQGSLDEYVNYIDKAAKNIASQKALFTSIREKVENSRQGSIRVFSVGISNHKFSRELVEGIAKAGQGLSISVPEGQRLEKSATRILREALRPHYEDGTLEVNYGQDDDDFELIEATEIFEEISFSETEEMTTSSSSPRSVFKDKSLLDTHLFPQLIQAPYKIPSLFSAAKPTVYILMSPETIHKNPTSITLLSPSAPTLEIPIQILPELGTTIHQLAAPKAALDISASHGWVFNSINQLTSAQNPELAKREAIRLGETFQTINKYCLLIHHPLINRQQRQGDLLHSNYRTRTNHASTS
ncbi:hypothetical protein EG329_005315 [Mollisiaceae sp. DMI_Dod_QoI]|nr:hypothetical protein EG329_005315 [Helotiales sp. DMI_Dod_QoI]